jgi:hypothetical protein
MNVKLVPTASTARATSSGAASLRSGVRPACSSRQQAAIREVTSSGNSEE